MDRKNKLEAIKIRNQNRVANSQIMVESSRALVAKSRTMVTESHALAADSEEELLNHVNKIRNKLKK